MTSPNAAPANDTTPDHLVIATPPSTGNIDLDSLGIEGDFALIDVETTGLDAAVDKIVEIAVLRRRGDQYEVFSSLVNPGFPIPPTAMAVHHITDEMVADAPKIEDIAPDLHRMIDGSVRIAHNAALDSTFVDPALGEEADPSKWLCTYRAARHLLPLAPAFGNQVLRYWLKVQVDDNGAGAHRAMFDVDVTAEVLGHILAQAKERGAKTMADVQALSQQPIIVATMPFGKHVGKKLEEIPADYFEWALRELKVLDHDLRGSIEAEMARRCESQPQQGRAPTGDRDPGQTQMPFGKHRGTPLKDLPLDYLIWALGTNLRPPLMEDVTKVVAERKAAGEVPEQRRRDQAAAPAAPAAAPATRPPARAPSSSAGGYAPRTPAAAANPAQRRASFFGAAKALTDTFDGDDMVPPADPEPEAAFYGSPSHGAASTRRMRP